MKAIHTAIVFLGMAAATAASAQDTAERQPRPDRAAAHAQHMGAEHMEHTGRMDHKGAARKGDRQHPPFNEPMTREQFLERSAKHFAHMDSDQNGTVSPDEARAFHEKMRDKRQARGELRKHEGSGAAGEQRRRAPRDAQPLPGDAR